MPWGLPQINISAAGSVSLQRFGSSGPGVFDQGAWNLSDTLSNVRGRHFLKMGGDYSRAHFLDWSAASARRTFSFRNLWSYANDAPYQESGNFDPVTGKPSDNTRNLNFFILALFVQDDWKVRPDLTVSLGLRCEYYFPMKSDGEVISNRVFGSGAEALTRLRLKISDSLATTRKANLGPQVGVSWNHGAFGSRLVLRGGFGIGYNVQQLASLSNGRSNPPWITSLTLNGANNLYGIPSDAHSFTDWPVNPAAKQTFDSTTGLPVGGAAVNLTGFPESQATPVTYRYSMDAQYNLRGSWVATVGYQGSQSRNYSRQRNLSLNYYPNLNPRVNRLAWFSNDAAAHYNALLTQVQHRFSRSFTLDAQYRLSRSTDQGSQDYYSDNYPFDINASNGPADFDVTHDFKVWSVWTPFLLQGYNKWLDKLTGGWTISGILNAHSGFP